MLMHQVWVVLASRLADYVCVYIHGYAAACLNECERRTNYTHEFVLVGGQCRYVYKRIHAYTNKS
jgi:hypothetical protein